MWMRLQWGLINAFGYAVVAITLPFLLPEMDVNRDLVIGLSVGGFTGGFFYLVPPPNRWRKRSR